MKVYLILLAISVMATLVTYFDNRIYLRKNYTRIKYAPLDERILGKVKLLILCLLIFPSVLSLLLLLFSSERYYEMVDNAIDEEYWDIK